MQILAITMLLAITHADSSFSREPSLAAVVPIDLPDGQTGEMRLFHGNGVYVEDPVRLIVLDATGHLVGYSPESFPISIICSTERKCVGYAHRQGVVLEFDPTTKYLGPVITDGPGAGLWFGSRNTILNIRVRAPTSSEFAAANWEIVKDNSTEIALIFVAGVFMLALVLALIRFGVRASFGVFVQFIIWIVVLGSEFILLALSFWPVFLGDISIFLWMLPLGFGAIFVVIVWLMFRLLRRRPPHPAAA